jgi:3-deoxy-D-manno-octulosonic-acid transferase
MRWLIDWLLGLGLLAASPVWIYRMIRHGRYRTGIRQRFGEAPVRYGLQPVIWVHAVSAGEINAARPVVAELHSQLPDFQVLVSSTTDTGLAAAQQFFARDHVVFAWPLDFSAAVCRALDRLRPSLVVLIEGELWPNFLAACRRRGIPVVVVNGRISPRKGYRRYRYLGRLGRLLLGPLTAIGVQDETYAKRFIELGADPDRVHVTGMVKFDVPAAQRVDGQEELAAAMGIDPQGPLLAAGSTGPAEEKIVLDVYRRLRRRWPALQLAIIPRKPERFDEVARLVEADGFMPVRRSQRPDGPRAAAPPQAVFLGDTMGELRKFYALAACIFVGRSLVPMGGSDMIEAAALGKPAAFGPHTYNFPQADGLARHGCARVADEAALEAQLEAWLADPAGAEAAGKAAQDFILAQQGATRRNVDMIARVLGRVPAARPGDVATDAIQEMPQVQHARTDA